MIPALALLKPVGDFLKSIPWQVWAGIALFVALLFARSHWIGEGVERCEAKHKAAFDKAVAAAQKQERAAPAIAEAAREAVKPRIQERIKVIREQIPAGACSDDYPDGVQAVVREAAAAAD